MDTVIIRGLEVRARHGVHAEEKVTPQRFIFDADIYCDFLAAARDDDISKTVSYSEVCRLINDIASRNTFNLIEKLAYECAAAILDGFPATGVKITVYKPEAPVKLPFGTVGVTAELTRERVFLSLGSSMGDRQYYLDAALSKLGKIRGVKVVRCSSCIETDPVGGVAQNKFLNCAVEINTYLPPQALLRAVQKIETECGRVRDKKWEDRTLDIDIIFYGGKIIDEEGLIVPHPLYAERAFVVGPLKEIAPEFMCPLSKKRIKNL